jgi:ATP-dependent DNA helicase RecQ
VYRLKERGARYGKAMVSEILRGSRGEKLLRAGFESLSTYGIMSDADVRQIRLIIDELVRREYLSTEGVEYPVLCLTEKARTVLRGGEKVIMMLPREEKAPGKTGKPGTRAQGSGSPSGDVPEELFSRLKELRARLAREAAVPAYVIFSDASLKDMCRRRPETAEQFLEVSGVGEVKLERYGEAFLSALREFRSEV